MKETERPLNLSGIKYIGGCTGKVPFTTRRLAKSSETVSRPPGMATGEVYKCAHCNLWHISRQGKINWRKQAAKAARQ